MLLLGFAEQQPPVQVGEGVQGAQDGTGEGQEPGRSSTLQGLLGSSPSLSIPGCDVCVPSTRWVLAKWLFSPGNQFSGSKRQSLSSRRVSGPSRSP